MTQTIPLARRLMETLGSLELRAVLAKDQELQKVIRLSVTQARVLTESGRGLESRAWLAATAAVLERAHRERQTESLRLRARIMRLREALGGNNSAHDVAKLLVRASTLDPDTTSRLLKTVERAIGLD